MTGSVMAANTATVAVSANVVGSCTIAGGSIPFGNLNAAGAGIMNAVVTQPQVNCSNGLAYSVTDDDGQNELAANTNRMASGGNYISYSFTYTAAGTGTGALANMDIAASIAEVDYLGKPVGNYTDTVTLTVTP
jgi:spore coat protein U-like protein